MKRILHRWWEFSTPRLLARAYKALDNYDSENAIEIGDKLIARRYSGGFEVKARGLHQLGKGDEAIEVLEAGVKQAPSVFILWSYLGEYLSNRGDYQDALAAFHQAEQMGDKPFISRLNIAIVYGRMGDPAMALQFLEGVSGNTDREIQAETEARGWFLVLSGRNTEALEYARNNTARFPDSDQLVGHMSKAYYALGELEEARESALKAISMNKRNSEATEVLRNLHGTTSPGARSYEVVVEGEREFERRMGRRERLGFFASYFVKAVDEAQALEFIKPFEPHSLRPLAIVKAVPATEKLEGPDGVYRAHGGYMFYTLND